MNSSNTFKFIFDLHKLGNNYPGVFFDSFGYSFPRNIHNQNKSIRPFVIFYNEGFYYYLTCRSAKNNIGLKTKFESEILVQGSSNSCILPEKDSYINTNRIFVIHENDFKQVVNFNSPKYSKTKSLLDYKDINHQMVVKRIKTKILNQLAYEPPQISLTKVYLNENKELIAEPWYASTNILETDKNMNNRANKEFDNILDNINVKNKWMINDLFKSLYQEWITPELNLESYSHELFKTLNSSNKPNSLNDSHKEIDLKTQHPMTLRELAKLDDLENSEKLAEKSKTHQKL